MVERRPYDEKYLRFERMLSRIYVGNWAAHLWSLWPGATHVHRIEHTLDLSRTGRPPLRIAFASDLHIGPTTPRRLLDNAFAHLAAMDADVLALGGDYVFLGATRERVAELKKRVADLPQPLKIAVLGNHDFWARPERLEDALMEVGVQVMVNRGTRLKPPHDDVAIIGLDDPFTGDAEVEEALATVPGAPITLAICHAPDALPAVQRSPVKLLLCGHTHGGHIALPGGKPVAMPSPIGRLYPWGRHQVDGVTLFVSRGIGGSLVPIRTFAPPDVVRFTIT